MELILQIVTGAGTREADRRKSFGRAGGRIGRATDCEWVLPSPYISRHHATISHAGNTFYIESTGENGLALNDPTQMLGRFDRHALKDGDRLFIDEMEIVVTLAGAGSSVSDASSGIPELSASGPGASLTGPLDSLDPAIDELDPLNRLLADAGSLAETAERAIPWNNSSSLADHFAPPRLEQALPTSATASTSSIAEDWDDEPSEHAERVEHAEHAAPPSRPAIEGFLTGADARADVTALTDDAAASRKPSIAGRLRGAASSARATAAPDGASVDGGRMPSDALRSMLQGLIDERQSRAQLAAELRLRNLPPAHSTPNPLHHAVNADDALRLLAPSPEPGRMTGPQAITDALEEIRAHQLATSAAIKAAFQSMLTCFDPQSLEARFDKRLKHAGVLPIGSKFRYWQLYVELFEELASGSDAGFQKLFGEAFAEAYELQLTTTKGRARQPPNGT